MDQVYPILQDVLNMRYTKNAGREECKLIYDESETRVVIHPDFRLVVLQSLDSQQSSTGELSVLHGDSAAPFQNRMEKYMVTFDCLFLALENSINKFFRLIEKDADLAQSPEKFSANYKAQILIHNYSTDLGISAVGLKPKDWDRLKLWYDDVRGLSDERLQEQYRRIVSMMSRKCFAATMEASKYEFFEADLQLFQDQHRFNSLAELLQTARRSRVQENSNLRTRHVVFTYYSVFECQSYPINQLKFDSAEISSSFTYQEKKKLVTSKLNSPLKDAVIFHFPSISSRKEIESIKYIINDLSSTNSSIRSKIVILMAHYSNSDLDMEPPSKLKRVLDTAKEKSLIESGHGTSSSVNFGDRIWELHAIDDLSKCEPRRYFETLRMTPLEYLETRASTDRIFKLVVSGYFQDYLESTEIYSDEHDSDEIDLISRVMNTNSEFQNLILRNLKPLFQENHENGGLNQPFSNYLSRKHMKDQLRISVDRLINDFLDETLKKYTMAIFRLVGVCEFHKRAKLEKMYAQTRAKKYQTEMEAQDDYFRDKANFCLQELEEHSKTLAGSEGGAAKTRERALPTFLDSETAKQIYWSIMHSQSLIQRGTSATVAFEEVKEIMQGLIESQRKPLEDESNALKFADTCISESFDSRLFSDCEKNASGVPSFNDLKNSILEFSNGQSDRADFAAEQDTLSDHARLFCSILNYKQHFEILALCAPESLQPSGRRNTLQKVAKGSMEGVWEVLQDSFQGLI